MKVITVCNRKGGCGKTTTAKNMAYNLANRGKEVLLIDMDPQRNATDGLSGREYKKSVVALLNKENIHKCIYHTRFAHLDLIPGNDYLASTDVESGIIRDQLMKLEQDYDYVFIDTSPYFNKLIAEIMLASDLCIIPTVPDEDSVKGMQTTIEELQLLYGSKVDIRILYTQVDQLKSTSADLQELIAALKPITFKRVIRYDRTAIKRARKKRLPLSKNYFCSKARKDYEAVTDELLEVLQND